MTPQERELVTELFDRLATLENTPRDPEAERGIMDGLQRAPNAVYALVQTALVQDEDARIRDLEGKLGMKPRLGFLTVCARPFSVHGPPRVAARYPRVRHKLHPNPPRPGSRGPSRQAARSSARQPPPPPA